MEKGSLLCLLTRSSRTLAGGAGNSELPSRARSADAKRISSRPQAEDSGTGPTLRDVEQHEIEARRSLLIDSLVVLRALARVLGLRVTLVHEICTLLDASERCGRDERLDNVVGKS